MSRTKAEREYFRRLADVVAKQDTSIPPSAAVERLPCKWDLVERSDRRGDGDGATGQAPNSYPGGWGSSRREP